MLQISEESGETTRNDLGHRRQLSVPETYENKAKELKKNDRRHRKLQVKKSPAEVPAEDNRNDSLETAIKAVEIVDISRIMVNLTPARNIGRILKKLAGYSSLSEIRHPSGNEVAGEFPGFLVPASRIRATSGSYVHAAVPSASESGGGSGVSRVPGLDSADFDPIVRNLLFRVRQHTIGGCDVINNHVNNTVYISKEFLSVVNFICFYV